VRSNRSWSRHRDAGGRNGRCTGDLVAKRGRITGNTTLNSQRVSVKALVPWRARGLSVAPQALTGGQGMYSLELSATRPCPRAASRTHASLPAARRGAGLGLESLLVTRCATSAQRLHAAIHHVMQRRLTFERCLRFGSCMKRHARSPADPSDEIAQIPPAAKPLLLPYC